MLDVDIEKILPITEVRDSLNKIIDAVIDSEDLYVVTKNGKPSAIIVGVHHLEKLTGIDHKMIIPEDTDVSEASEKAETIVNTPNDLATSDTPTLSSTSTDASTSDATTIPTQSGNTEDKSEDSTPETPIASTTKSLQDDTSTPYAPATTMVDDGLDDLFAPEVPTAQPTDLLTPSPAATVTPMANTDTALETTMPPVPTADMSPVPSVPTTMPAEVTSPAPTTTDSQPSQASNTTNPLINPTPPAQPPIPPTTNQV